MGGVRAKIGLTGQLDRRQPGNYFKPCNLTTGNTPQKIHFPFFLESQILASYMYVLNYKSTAARPILLKFGQIVAR